LVKNSNSDRDIRDQGRTPGVVAGVGSALPTPPPQPGVLTLDTHTPPNEYAGLMVKRVNDRRSRKLFSRIVWGLLSSGRYYFLTLTSSPQSPGIEKSLKKFWWWLKRYRPGYEACYCVTDEGYGVVHIVVRLGMKQKRLDAKTVRAYWEKIHQANQIKIRYVPDSKKEDLANYLADQRKRRGLGKEMSWQSAMVRWKYTRGWLPKGYGKAFGRTWVQYQDVPYGLRLMLISGWTKRCFKDPDQVGLRPPKVEKDSEVGWIIKESRCKIDGI